MSTLDKSFACDAILFDLDGVLIDSSACIVRHWQEWAAFHNLELDQILHIAHGMRTSETIRTIAPHLDVMHETRQFTAREIADTDGVTAITGAAEVLAQLPAGAWAIVTSGSLDLVRARLARAGLPAPSVLVTGDDVSQGKPSPEPYLTGAQRLGIAAGHCLVIEDAPAGVESGKKAGMPVIGIASTHPREALLEKGADFVIDSLSRLQVHGADQHDRLTVQLITAGQS